jgi:hypothetical protein
VRHVRGLRAAFAPYERDLLALSGVGCITVGLATVSLALALILLGAFLVFTSGSGRRR